MYHIYHLLLVMAGLGGSVVFHHRQGRPDHAVDLAGLAPTVALSVERRKFYDHIDRKLCFAAQKNPLLRYEDIIKDERRAILGIFEVTNVATVQFSGIQA